MSLIKIYIKKLLRIRLSPMEKIEVKVRKQYVKNVFKEDMKDLFFDRTQKDKNLLYFLLFSFFSLSLLLCFFVSSFILQILSPITFVKDNFSILLVFLTCLMPILFSIKCHTYVKMYKKSFDYHIDLEDIIEYAKYFKKDKQENIIKKIVSLICVNRDSMDFANFECYKDYIENDKKELYKNLTPEQNNIVKSIKEKIEQEEKNIILNKEKVH